MGGDSFLPFVASYLSASSLFLLYLSFLFIHPSFNLPPPGSGRGSAGGQREEQDSPSSSHLVDDDDDDDDGERKEN